MLADWNITAHGCCVMFHGAMFHAAGLSVCFLTRWHITPRSAGPPRLKAASSGLSPSGCTGDQYDWAVLHRGGPALRQVGRVVRAKHAWAVKILLDGENSPSPPSPPIQRKFRTPPLSDGMEGSTRLLPGGPVDVIQLSGQQLHHGTRTYWAQGTSGRPLPPGKPDQGFSALAYAKRELAECCYWDEGTSDPRWSVSEPGMEAPLSAPCCSTWSFLFFSPRALLAQPWRPGA